MIVSESAPRKLTSAILVRPVRRAPRGPPMMLRPCGLYALIASGLPAQMGGRFEAFVLDQSPVPAGFTPGGGVAKHN